MNASNLNGALSHGSMTTRLSEIKLVKKMRKSYALGASDGVCDYLPLPDRRKINSTKSLKNSYLSSNHIKLLTPSAIHHRRRTFSVIRNTIGSDSAVESYNVEESSDPKEEVLNGKTSELVGGTSMTSSKNVQKELIALALPAVAGQAFDPFAQLLETAFIGRLGPVELASAGVSISIFNIISKLFNIPLLSVATSFVAEDLSKIASIESTSDVGFQKEGGNGQLLGDARKQLPSVSTALLLAGGIGIFEAVALYCGSGMFINLMGISSASPMRIPAQRFLALRALGAPAVVVSLAIQGIFRGFKDTKTPLICLGAGNLTAVFLLPIFMYSFRLGVIGAAIATVISQYIVMILMIWFLNKRAILLPPKMENLHFDGYLKSGGFLIGRTLAILMTMTLGTSMAARQGPMPMAAHQICLQVWLAVSLLTDALAASGQAMIATSFSKGDYKTVKEITFLLLKTGLVTGGVLALSMGASFGSIATLFTNDVEVLRIVKSLLLFVCATQPINALAFIADGLYYGVSDFAYACFSMMAVGVMSSVCFLYAPSILGLTGVWWGLALCMGLRVAAGYIRLMSKTGPWWFLHKDIEQTEYAS